MEGERKKRKKESEEEHEEEEIEKFFALIRRTREVRELLKGNSSNESKDKKDEKKMVEEDKAAGAGAWNPSFQPEDFLEDDQSSGLHGEACPSKREKDDKMEDKGGNGLDLRLSL